MSGHVRRRRTGGRRFSFAADLAFSEGAAKDLDVAGLLVEQIPGAVFAHQAHKSNDKRGTDWWVEMEGRGHVSVDVKMRRVDYSRKGSDDLALETWSSIGDRVGWTRDPAKRTDYVMWFWADTRRWTLIPFAWLRGVFEESWRAWAKKYGTHEQPNATWTSQCVFVPRKVVWEAIYNKFGGRPHLVVRGAA